MHKYLQRFVLSLNGRIASSWLVLGIDLAIIWFSSIAVNVLLKNFDFNNLVWPQILGQSLFITIIFSISFLIFRSHVSIIRHTSFADAIKVFYAVTAAAAVLVLIRFNYFTDFKRFGLNISLSFIIMLANISLFTLIFVRVLIKLAYRSAFQEKKSSSINVMIYGAGELGMVTKTTLESKGHQHYSISGFIDNNPGKTGKTINGIRVYKAEDIDKDFISRKNIREIIFSIQNIDAGKKQKIIDDLLKLDMVVKIVPPVEDWIEGKLKINQIEKVRIEDLLQRDVINLDNQEVHNAIRDNRILVTGGAGSIGSEIVRQVLSYQPESVIVVDNAETPVFELQQAILKKYPSFKEKISFIIADITNQERIEKIFETNRPHIIFHAAAYKHVPLMEDYPEEAFRVNVLGTKTIADTSVKYNVDRFVMISTDKAVRPTNVMGASKRLAEMYCQSLGQVKNMTTKFITTRFGNVLGSNGSVVKIFRNQIAAGGPITVTHPDITRYFMTIPEACQLVLEAGIMGEGGEIFVFDMGNPVKVVDLANKMIKLAGLQPDIDIKIIYSGLRPGEKLYEELLNDCENTLPTYHPKIKIAKVNQILNGSVSRCIEAMKDALNYGDEYKMVEIIKKAIPEYISNNSRFSQLDMDKAKKSILV
jgi:FlaA1/EpsC-like NDP-sugar epimerase